MIASVGRMMRKGGGGLIWPKGLKESIKAIYDPAKQGMTNYDVIEAYVEDFTYWTIDNTGITSTPKKIVIPAGTELKYRIAFRGFNSFTAGFDIKYTGNIIIEYRYNKEDGTVGTIAIDKSGIYHLPASVRAQKNFGFYCNPQTVTDEATIEQLPTSILKDLSGNGNHAYLYGGKGKLNSGMGVYQQDFSKLIISRVDKKQDPFSFTVSGSGGTYLAYMQLGNWNNKAFKILANINAKSDYLHLRFRNNTDAVITSVALKNGENIIPAQNIEGATKAVFEYNADKNQFQNNSFGLNNLNDKHENGISYMTKNSYNGIPIKSRNLKALDILAIGAFIDNNFISSFNWKGCHGTVIVADHSFTEDEITWLKDNLFRK